MSSKRTRLKPIARERAATLRRNATAPEKLLWSALRSRQVGGLKFRRQHVVEPYVADFCCPSEMLILELEGESHEGRQSYDTQRQKFLEARGYRVLRFTNDDVIDNLEGVLRAILKSVDIDPDAKPPRTLK
jgi:very-short-patch-repair endonuclease